MSSESSSSLKPSDEKEEYFHNLFPKRQLWKPNKEYPLWDANWDGRHPILTDDKKKNEEQARYVRKHGVTRHIILVRHGQYDETYKEDEKRVLTALGREQAKRTGERLAELLLKNGQTDSVVMRVSNLTRAKETADIIAPYLSSSVTQTPPDARLNEGRPCHNIPCRVNVSPRTIKAVDDGHERIEQAFQSYFFRHTVSSPTDEDGTTDSNETKNEKEKTEENQNESTITKNEENKPDPKASPKHEYEIIVCHANVIRYFTCRALQIPPEVWLRLCIFNCSLTYLTIRPTGTVSCRLLGDIGHLDFPQITFSNHYGFNW